MNRIEILMKIKELENLLKTLTDEKARWVIVERLVNLDIKLIKFDNRLTN